jgi:hypothetical protein
MPHFTEQQWADWVRGVAVSETTSAVQVHIANSCPDCNRAFELWKHVGDLASAEQSYIPPENLVRQVKLEFTLRHSPQEEGTLAGMIYDSLAQPLPVGIRGAALAMRQVLYEAEGLTVDLRLEREPNSNQIHASGQALSKEVPLCWVADAAIVLWNDKGQMVTTTESNHHGEFQLKFEAEDQLRLTIASAGRKTLRISLGNLT